MPFEKQRIQFLKTSSKTYFSLTRQIRDTVNWIFSEQMLVYYINLFRDAFWPNGKLAPPNTIPRQEQSRARSQETKQRAQQKLLENIPGEAWVLLLKVGQKGSVVSPTKTSAT